MIYVYLANGFEEVEAFTVVDYLRRCDSHNVKTVGLNGKMVTGAHMITVIADINACDVDLNQVEMIVLPGGMPGTINLEKSSDVKKAICYCNENKKYIAAICAAPSILGHMGLLKEKNATCFMGFEEQLMGANVTQSAVEISDNIITSRAAGTANQFAFALINLLYGEKIANHLKESIIWKES